MICNHCNTPNEPGYQFCVKCGQRLEQSAVPSVTAQSHEVGVGFELSSSPFPRLGTATLRVLLILVALWLAKSVLLGMPFVEKSFQPGWEIQIPGWISLVFSFLSAFALFFYASEIWVAWPVAFPVYAGARTIFSGAVALAAFVPLYDGVYPLVIAYDRFGELLFAINFLFLVVSVGIILWMLAALFQGLPVWLLRMRFSQSPVSLSQVCRVCGAVNPVGVNYCGSCGTHLG